MKIGMMCLWNAANGPSIHAELVGRAWVKLGHQVRVFSAKKHPDARPTFQKDEDFVIRHFQVDKIIPFTRASDFDPSPLLNEDYNAAVRYAEKLEGNKDFAKSEEKVSYAWSLFHLNELEQAEKVFSEMDSSFSNFPSFPNLFDFQIDKIS